MIERKTAENDAKKNITTKPSESRVDENSQIASVLIVEDDLTLAALWQRFLQSHGCQVDVCSNVEDAEILIKSNNYDVAIIDIFLDEGSGGMAEGGVTLINRLRLKEVVDVKGQRLMVIAITGSVRQAPGEYNVFDSIRSISDSLLYKPVPLGRLRSEVNRLVSEAA